MDARIQAVLSGDSSWCVIHGDCADVLKDLGKGVVTHIITDPPYDEHTHASARKHGKEDRSDRIEIDFDPIAPSTIVPPMLRVARRWTVAFCAFEMVGDYAKVAGQAWIRTGIYRRTNGAPQFSGDRPGQPGEAVAVMHGRGRKKWNGGGRSAFWEFAVERTNRSHPCQKPLALMLELVRLFTDPGDVILDPYCGSGTTGVAAVTLGRKFIGVEIDAKHAKGSEARVREAYEVYVDQVSDRVAFDTVIDSTVVVDTDTATFDLFMGDLS